jgi:hypothetical protein
MPNSRTQPNDTVGRRVHREAPVNFEVVPLPGMNGYSITAVRLDGRSYDVSSDWNYERPFDTESKARTWISENKVLWLFEQSWWGS